jgi:hypothetical protein
MRRLDRQRLVTMSPYEEEAAFSARLPKGDEQCKEATNLEKSGESSVPQRFWQTSSKRFSCSKREQPISSRESAFALVSSWWRDIYCAKREADLGLSLNLR